MLWTWIAVVEAAWVIALSAWIVSERRPPASTLAWIFGLALLPAVGVAVYFFLGPRRLERKRLRYRGGAARLEASLAATARLGDLPLDVSRQVRLALRLSAAPLASASSLALYHDGVSAFAAMERSIADAVGHVHLESYIFEPDETGTRIRDLLAEKARQGVAVRLLLDAVGAPRARRRFLAPILDAGGEVARFNPMGLGLVRSRLVNFRTHRKVLVCDGAVGFTGGMNVADCHTVGERHGATVAPPWRDTQIRLAGRAVAGLQRTFLEDWHFATGLVPETDACFPDLPGEGSFRVQVLRSGPDRDVYPIHEFLFSAIASADERVWLATPYLVPDESILTALCSAAHRGVDVRVLVPRRGDSRLVQAAMRSFYAELLAAGVTVQEFRPSMLHAKLLVVDRELTVVGSANFDNRSFRLNFEAVVAVYGAPIADEVANQLLLDAHHATRVTSRRLRALSLPSRFAQSTARLFAAVL